jgi:hypothetical protein
MPAGSGSPGGRAGLEGLTPAAPGLMGGRGPAYRTSHGGHGLSVAAGSGLLDQPRRSPAAQGSHGVPQADWGVEGKWIERV